MFFIVLYTLHIALSLSIFMVQSRKDFSFVFEALREKKFLSVPAEFALAMPFVTSAWKSKPRVEVDSTCSLSRVAEPIESERELELNAHGDI